MALVSAGRVIGNQFKGTGPEERIRIDGFFFRVFQGKLPSRPLSPVDSWPEIVHI